MTESIFTLEHLYQNIWPETNVLEPPMSEGCSSELGEEFCYNLMKGAEGIDGIG